MGINQICKEYGIKNYIINPDGSIDVDGSVSLYRRVLRELPLKFGVVTGDFDCSFNQLTSLIGCPSYVGQNFKCTGNDLSRTGLEGCPQEVGGHFECLDNQLTTLKGGPRKVGGNFWCWNNKLTNLKYVPECATIVYDPEIPLYECRYIFMHKVRYVVTGENSDDNILNKLINANITIPEKIQKLKEFINIQNAGNQSD